MSKTTKLLVGAGAVTTAVVLWRWLRSPVNTELRRFAFGKITLQPFQLIYEADVYVRNDSISTLQVSQPGVKLLYKENPIAAVEGESSNTVTLLPGQWTYFKGIPVPLQWASLFNSLPEVIGYVKNRILGKAPIYAAQAVLTVIADGKPHESKIDIAL